MGRTPHAPPRTFDDVYRDERRKLVRTAYLMVRSQHVAEELVHDGFVRLHQNFADVERPGGFLHTAVVHLCLTWLKRRDMEQDRLQRLDDPVEPEQEPDELWDAIGRLDPDRRAVLVLRYYEDLSYEQIAAVIGCPVGTVRSRLNRGVADLRKEIEP
jgi:RNA polymerase sigma-70 factor (ECF subfamily)